MVFQACQAQALLRIRPRQCQSVGGLSEVNQTGVQWCCFREQSKARYTAAQIMSLFIVIFLQQFGGYYANADALNVILYRPFINGKAVCWLCVNRRRDAVQVAHPGQSRRTSLRGTINVRHGHFFQVQYCSPAYLWLGWEFKPRPAFVQPECAVSSPAEVVVGLLSFPADTAGQLQKCRR